MRPAYARFLTIISGIFVLAFVALTAHTQAFAAGESILWNFDGADGDNPLGLVRDKAGNLYGTTYSGGLNQQSTGFRPGTAFELLPPRTGGGSWRELVLWNFGGGTDGWLPSTVIIDASGNLYGTTSRGGTYDEGTVFELSPPPVESGTWTETILWSFTKGADGGNPVAPVIFDTKGDLLGTTNLGGVNGGGTAFELTPPAVAGGSWTESTLWSFGKGADGKQPAAGLIADRGAGSYYGTTSSGGAYFNGSAGELGGTVFRLSPPQGGKRWGEKVLWSFCGSTADGCAPVSPLMLDDSGNLYGTTQYGGPDGCGLAPEQDVDYPIYPCGTAFQLARTSNNPGASWAESVIWNFGSGTDGYLPQTGLIKSPAAADSGLYGTTARGGLYANPLPQHPGGTAFVLYPPAGTGLATEKILEDFGSFTGDTGIPSALIFGPNQTTLYGAGFIGGNPGDGTVFQLIIPD